MLRLFLNNTELEVPEDVSIPITLKNPIFNKMGSYSLSFSLKRTAINDVAFSFPSRIERSGKRTLKYSNFKIQFEHYQINCSINVTEPDSVGYKINCQIDEGDFYSLIQNINMPDVVYDGDVSIGTTSADVLAHALSVVSQTYPSVNYQFPQVWNKDFYEEYPDGSTGLINEWNSTSQWFLPNIIYEPDTLYKRTTLVPYPYLLYVLKKLCTHFKYSPAGKLFDHTDLQHLIMHNNFALDEVEKKYYVRAERNADQIISGVASINFLNDSTAPNEDADNLFDLHNYTVPVSGYYNVNVEIRVTTTSEIPIEILIEGGTSHYYHPAINVNGTVTLNCETSLLQAINETMYLRVSTVGSTTFTVNYAKIIFKATSQCRLNIFKKSINIQNHVPDIKASDFVDAIQNAFGCIALVNNTTREINFKFLKDILISNKIEDVTAITEEEEYQFYITDLIGKFSFANVGTIVDFSKYEFLGFCDYIEAAPTPTKIGQVVIVSNVQSIYLSKVNSLNILVWNFFGNYHNPYVIGEGTEIKANLGLMKQTYFHDYLLGGLNVWTMKFMPCISEKGISTAYNSEQSKSLFLITFYAGLQSIEKGSTNLTPCAHPAQKLDYGEADRTLDLAWDGDYGLFKQFWAEWVYWYNNIREGVKRIIHWTPILLNQLEWDKKYRIKNINYFVDSIELNLTKHKIVIGETKLLKC